MEGACLGLHGNIVGFMHVQGGWVLLGEQTFESQAEVEVFDCLVLGSHWNDCRVIIDILVIAWDI